ncbi:MAG: phytanoyl-CoA dioxygenase family protein [Planctomycetaceae bacterium]|nr:phytanoyl-CoA dioxygenase family protein [Planctomycetaceae bacterium]
MPRQFNDETVAEYRQHGFVVVPQLFDVEEIDLLRRCAKEDQALDAQSFDRADGEGGRVRLSLWNYPSDEIYGMIARCRRVVDAAEQLLEDEAYHYHSKMIMKQARTGGAWAWHQDYGYWYNNGVLTPNLCSVFIAVDPATRENGCMQVLAGSHHMGRVNHGKVGEQTGADPERVAVACERYELKYVEMAPGDALFFHSNLLHRSDQNHSDHDRWALICCYNARSNDPYKEGEHPGYNPLEKVDDDAVRAAGRRRLGSTS